MIWRYSFAHGVFIVVLASLTLVGMYRFGLSLTWRRLREHRNSDDPLLRITAVERAAVMQTQNTLAVRLCVGIIVTYLLIPLHGWENVIPAIVFLAILWMFHRVEARRLREIEAGR